MKVRLLQIEFLGFLKNIFLNMSSNEVGGMVVI